MLRILSIALSVGVFVGFAKKNSYIESPASVMGQEITDTMIIANLYRDSEALHQIQSSFTRNNPGYTLEFFRQTYSIRSRPEQRVLFVQKGGGTAILNKGERSKIAVGDIILLDAGVSMSVDSLVDVVAFTTPDPPSTDIPHFIRPDWDLNITDTPGGCATETNAYRRILLTWQGKVGKYLYKSLNAHRVRITDSFTHYHPLEGGFDEFYLVQMVQPEASIITGNHHDLIINPELVTRDMAPNLLKKTKLQVGDLVYLPRGVVHRGIDGVLAQVITVPGFIPGAELGVDHHLKKINERLQLTGKEALPYHVEAADTVMVK